MKTFYIFRHIDIEGPGYLGKVLQRHGIPFRLICVDQDEEIPDSLDSIGGLVFLGGPMSVNDELPWITKELSLIRRAAQQRLPILGHCLGAQLISKALGGTISANASKEIGWLDVEALHNPQANDWLAGLPKHFEVFHWHGETFSIPRGATAILQSQYCDHQAFVCDNILALQFHCEITAEMVVSWGNRYQQEISTPAQIGASVQSQAQMAEQLDARIGALHKVADILYANWIGKTTESGKGIL